MPGGQRPLRIIEITPTLDSGAYASGDHLGGIQTLSGIVRSAEADFAGAMLHAITVVDAANQKVAIDLLFFDEEPTGLGADNAAVDIADAQLVGKCIGMFSIAAADFVTIDAAGDANAVACKREVNLPLKAVAGAVNCFVMAIVRSGTPTFGVSGLTFKYAVEPL